jgi:hypothetical protein
LSIGSAKKRAGRIRTPEREGNVGRLPPHSLI